LTSCCNFTGIVHVFISSILIGLACHRFTLLPDDSKLVKKRMVNFNELEIFLGVDRMLHEGFVVRI
jgi:hypothetical protein